MSIKTRIKKLEQQHSPQEQIIIRIVHTGDDGSRYDYHTGEALPPATCDTIVVSIPDNGRS